MHYHANTLAEFLHQDWNNIESNIELITKSCTCLNHHIISKVSVAAQPAKRNKIKKVKHRKNSSLFVEAFL